MSVEDAKAALPSQLETPFSQDNLDMGDDYIEPLNVNPGYTFSGGSPRRAGEGEDSGSKETTPLAPASKDESIHELLERFESRLYETLNEVVVEQQHETTERKREVDEAMQPFYMWHSKAFDPLIAQAQVFGFGDESWQAAATDVFRVVLKLVYSGDTKLRHQKAVDQPDLVYLGIEGAFAESLVAGLTGQAEQPIA